LINTLKSLLYYHGQVLTILTFSHHVYTTQIFSVKRMQHTAKQRPTMFFVVVTIKVNRQYEIISIIRLRLFQIRTVYENLTF
jgi:hypothetical protein